ncbi:MAG TPA: FecR family protein [Planctomicrobium sp.]|nr:FecR family protein [Planctomicrobium sp.]
MSHSEHSSGPIDPSLEIEFLQRVVRFQDGTLSPDELAAFEAELLADPVKLQIFADLQLQSAAIVDLSRQNAYQTSTPVSQQALYNSRSGKLMSFGGWVLAACCLVLICIQASWWQTSVPTHNPELAQQNSIDNKDQIRISDKSSTPDSLTDPASVASVLPADVRLTGASRANFLGELVPPLQSTLTLLHSYVLTSGLVEISFPDGASVIIESPAVFRIEDSECLALDTGRCSVHAPEGAEGFRVETPVSRVVDRGTRFHVNVSDYAETEVQVIEGIADVYLKPEGGLENSATRAQPELPFEIRLENKEAKRFGTGVAAATAPMEFSPDHYRHQLPDRVIRYRATTTPNGEVEELLGVTVQRNGIMKEYPVEDLIPIELTWFKSYSQADTSGHLVGTQELPERREAWLEDRFLTTGVINPGGQKRPLQSDPVMQLPEDPDHPNTPGFAVRFRSPVVNRPGPDIVFFELQSLTNPPDGDAFHVSPVQFTPGRRSLTVRVYDLTLVSPEAQKLAPFYLYQFPVPIHSLDELENQQFISSRRQSNFRILATGIDLSDLGFQDGEQVEELFFQDADDDEKRSTVDPVLIVGLPDDQRLHRDEVME